MGRWRAWLAAAAALGDGLRTASAAPAFRELASEAEALALLRRDEGAAVAECGAEEASWLIARSWWNAARELVTASHSKASQEQQVALHSAVRRDVGEAKRQAEELLFKLADKGTAQVGVVRCAFQWAQNSSAVFLSVKFAHRWSSPGALEVTDERVEVTPCCLNFTAAGMHSQTRKSYSLNLEFLEAVDPNSWSWRLASAGRMTVEIAKQEPKRWARLLKSKDRPSSMAAWDSMNQRWSEELSDFERKQKRQDTPKGQPDADVKEVADEEKRRASSRKCVVTPHTPFKTEPQVQAFCQAYWPPRLREKDGQEKTWLVLFHSPTGMKCQQRGDECVKVRDRWTAVEKKMRDLGVAKVGAVDCDEETELCRKQEVGHMPFIRRYVKGKRKTFYGEWDIDSLMAFVNG